MSKNDRRHARQPVSRVTRNQPSSPRAPGKGPIKPAGGAPRGQSERQDRAPYGHGQERRHADDKRRFEHDERKPFGQQRDDRKPFGKPEGRYGDERKPYGKSEGRSGDERKPYGKSEGRFGDERKPYGKSEGRFGDERKPFGKDRDDRRSGDERKPYGKPEGRFGDERKPYGKSEGRSGDERKPYGKSEGRFGDERKPYAKSESRFGEERQYGNKPKAPPTVARAKKLQVRDPNQKVQDRTRQLRETRVDIDSIEPVRLQKALAASGAGSRREMEEAIEAGQVLVNGKAASLGDKVGPRDRVTLKGHPIKLKWADRLPRIIIYHKQEGEIVSRDDPGGRVTVFDRLPQAKSSRWVTVGRLDVNTSGLLIITTSGELANRLAHPSFEAEREYAVRVLGELTDEQKKALTSEILLEDGPAKFERLIDQGGEGANHWYRVVIKEGRNREVRRMFEAYGLTVSRLIRLRFGNVGLPARLKRGQFYELNELEVANVMKWAGLTATGQVKVKN
jgi:23S rRNA pseudouridine2605 synthase